MIETENRFRKAGDIMGLAFYQDQQIHSANTIANKIITKEYEEEKESPKYEELLLFFDFRESELI